MRDLSRGVRVVALTACCAAFAARGEAQPRQLTNNTVPDVPMAGEPAWGARIWASCGGRVCLLPDRPDYEPPGWRTADALTGGGGAPAAWRERALAWTFSARERRFVPVLLTPSSVEPIEASAASYRGCEVRGYYGPPATEPEPPGRLLWALASPFRGTVLANVRRLDGCSFTEGFLPFPYCPTWEQFDHFLMNGASSRRLTRDCADNTGPYGRAVPEGDHVAWSGVRATGTRSSTTELAEHRCGVWIDERAVLEVPQGRAVDPTTCPEVRDFLDGTVLIRQQMGVGATAETVWSLSHGGSRTLAEVHRASVTTTPTVTLLRGGAALVETVETTTLVDRAGGRHVLESDPGWTVVHEGARSSDGGRFAYFLRVGEGWQLRLWDGTTDRLLDPGTWCEPEAPVVAGSRVAWTAVRCGASRKPLMVTSRDASGAETTQVVVDDSRPYPGTLEERRAGNRRRLHLTPRTLFWVGYPPNADGSRADAEIFAADVATATCIKDAHGQELGEVRVTHRPASGPPVDLWADLDGCVALDGAGGTVRVTLRDASRLVRVYHGAVTAPDAVAWFEAPVAAHVTPATATAASFGPVDPTVVGGLATIYHWAHTASRFAGRRLYAPEVLAAIDPGGTDTPALAEVRVVAYDPGAVSRYVAEGGGGPTIYIKRASSDAPQPESSRDVTLHEYSHHVTTHSRLVRDTSGCMENHGGLTNGSSADSFWEGLAIYLPSMIKSELHLDTVPQVYRWSSGASEDSATAAVWAHCGLREDMAFGGALWRAGQQPDDLTNLWVAMNRARCRDVSCAWEALTGLHGAAGRAPLEAVFAAHGFCVDANGNAWCDAGETVGRAALRHAFALEHALASTGGAGAPCRELPSAGVCARDGHHVVRGRSGTTRMGTLPPGHLGSVCRGTSNLEERHLLTPSPVANWGSVVDEACDGSRSDRGYIDERRVLVLPNAARQDMPDDLEGAPRVELVDGASGRALTTGALAGTVTCTGATPRSYEVAGVPRDLPRRLVLGVPAEAGCSLSMTLSAPGYRPSAPLRVTGEQALAGTLPASHRFVVMPSGEPERPTVRASADPAAGSAPFRVRLRAEVRGGVAPHRVRWYLDDGAVRSGAEVEHLLGGLYDARVRARVVVIDAMGVFATAEVTVDSRGPLGGAPDAGTGPGTDGGVAADAAMDAPQAVDGSAAVDAAAPPDAAAAVDGGAVADAVAPPDAAAGDRGGGAGGATGCGCATTRTDARGVLAMALAAALTLRRRRSRRAP